MIALSEELKEEIIRDEPGGLWLILGEETASDALSAIGLPCGEPDENEG